MYYNVTYNSHEITVTLLKDDVNLTRLITRALSKHWTIKQLTIKGNYSWYITEFISINVLILEDNVESSKV